MIYKSNICIVSYSLVFALGLFSCLFIDLQPATTDPLQSDIFVNPPTWPALTLTRPTKHQPSSKWPFQNSTRFDMHWPKSNPLNNQDLHRTIIK